jgi:hypothetical protein
MGPVESASLSFCSLHGSTASICASVNAELHEVAVADLRGMPSLPPEDFAQRVDRLRTASDQSWSLAQQRESIMEGDTRIDAS